MSSLYTDVSRSSIEKRKQCDGVSILWICILRKASSLFASNYKEFWEIATNFKDVILSKLMTVNCKCTECDCKEVILSMDKDDQFLCSSCRLGKHGHKVWNR